MSIYPRDKGVQGFALRGVFVFCALLLLVIPANASLIGVSVDSILNTQYSGSWTQSTATVSSEIEFTQSYNGGLEGISLDVGASSFTFNFFNDYQGSENNPSGIFNLGLLGFQLTNLNDSEGAITNIVLSSSTFPDGTFTNTSFTANSFAWETVSLLIPGKGTNWTATWDITNNSTTVPEPASLLLLSMGLSALGLAAYKRKLK